MRAPTTPSSLKWLINRRARLDGAIDQAERAEALRAASAQELIDELQNRLHDASETEQHRRMTHAIALSALPSGPAE